MNGNLRGVVCLIAIALISGTTARAGVTFSKVADTSTPIPGGSGTFTSFDTIPSISGNLVVFRGNGTGGQNGVYATLGGLSKIADHTTPIPGGQGVFADFSNTAVLSASAAFVGRDNAMINVGFYGSSGGAVNTIVDRSAAIPGGTGDFTSIDNAEASGGNVAFRGTGIGSQQGIYFQQAGGSLTRVVDNTVPMPGAGGNFSFLAMGDLSATTVAFRGFSGGAQGLFIAPFGSSLITAADTSTPLPGGNGNFEYFDSPLSLSGTDLAFHGGGGGDDAIFLFHNGARIRIADLKTFIPSGTGTFTSFYPLVATDGGIVAFLGYGIGGQRGIYSYEGGVLEKVLDLNTTLDGKSVSDLFFYSEGLDARNLLFQANFTDGSSGLFIASVPEPSAIALAAVGMLALSRRRPETHSAKKMSCD